MLVAADGIWDTVYDWFIIAVFANIFVPVIIIPTNIFGKISVTVNVVEDTGIEPVNDLDKIPVIVPLVISELGDWDTL